MKKRRGGGATMEVGAHEDRGTNSQAILDQVGDRGTGAEIIERERLVGAVARVLVEEMDALSARVTELKDRLDYMAYGTVFR